MMIAPRDTHESISARLDKLASKICPTCQGARALTDGYVRLCPECGGWGRVVELDKLMVRE